MTSRHSYEVTRQIARPARPSPPRCGRPITELTTILTHDGRFTFSFMLCILYAEHSHVRAERQHSAPRA